MRPPTSNPITQGKHGNYNAVDYSSRPDVYIYAPEGGKVTFYQYAGNCGNNLQFAGVSGYTHGFCHLETSYVKVGQTIQKGQKIGKMGYTGLTDPVGPNGRHLHWVLRKGNTYYYPPSKVTEPFKGETMSADATIKKVFRMGLSREPDSGAFTTYRKTTDLQLIDSVYGSSERASKLKAWGVSGWNFGGRITNLVNYANKVNAEVADLKSRVADKDGRIAELGRVVEIKDTEIQRLQAAGGDLNKWETLKALIKELFSFGKE